jgi:hypothetical protein
MHGNGGWAAGNRSCVAAASSWLIEALANDRIEGTVGYDPSSEYRHTSGGAPGEPKRQYGNEGCGDSEDNLHDSVQFHSV